MRLEHGEHNEELCDHLLHEMQGRFGDWVVTTAFYACIHFVDHALFPARIDGKHFADFDSYCSHQHDRQDRRSKHSLKAHLVKKRMPKANGKYKRLMEDCMHVRYIDYTVSDQEAIKANRSMKAIKKYCLERSGKAF